MNLWRLMAPLTRLHSVLVKYNSFRANNCCEALSPKLIKENIKQFTFCPEFVMRTCGNWRDH